MGKPRRTRASGPRKNAAPAEQKVAAAPKITLISYSETEFQDQVRPRAEECARLKDRQMVSWVNVDGIHDEQVIETLGEQFGLHPLTREDIGHAVQRPKMEDYDHYVYVVLKMLSYNEQAERTQVEQVSLILAENLVISFQEEHEGDVFDGVRERLRTGKGHVRKMGADYLLYSLMDALVDNYFLICEKVGEKIEPLQEDLVARPSPRALQRIHDVRGQVMFLRRAVWPLREVVGGLERSESHLVGEPTRRYLRDVYDHTVQVMETIETHRDMLSSMVDIYMSSVSNKLNEIMKVLTIIATIFIPLSFVTGIYGMNFRFMPELEWPWGYPVVLLVMLAAGVGMLLYFRKKRWM